MKKIAQLCSFDILFSGKKATAVSNLLLSILALSFGVLPETDRSALNADPVLSAVFRDQDESPVSPYLERPQWMLNTKAEVPQIRAQSPGGYYETPPMTAPLGSTYPTYQPTDPFQGGTDPVLPFLNDPGPMVYSGINGPQPHRLGFMPLFDATYIAPSSVKGPGTGHFGVQEYDAGLRHTSDLGEGWAFVNTLQGGARLWDGPGAPSLPGSVYRAGWDFLFTTPQAGPWSGQIDFNPSVNSDFHSSLHRQAFNLDGNVTAFYRTSPQVLWVLGVQYWDRVDKMILPNAGVVWNPNDRTELRLLFPKSRISYFLGNFGDAAHWLYATGEYHVESYQVSTPGSSANQVQIRDWRFGIGLRSDHSWYDKYVEVGYVIGRQATFLNTSPDFNIGDGFMARLGVRF